MTGFIIKKLSYDLSSHSGLTEVAPEKRTP